jgi:MinD-like ATPase involved in chromosome partitioning or flagellar assembly
MPKTILIHSFRHGVGRSNIAANMAFLLAQKGQRVAIIDTDTESPAVHILFGMGDKDLRLAFNDYLLGTCEIHQAAYDLTTQLKATLNGRLFLVPGHAGNGTPPRQLHNTQDVHLLNTGCKRLIDSLNLDVVIIDTQPGVKENSLVAITISDTLVVVLRLDQRDYQGTSVTMDVVRQLNIPRIALIVNEAPDTYDFNQVKVEMHQTYNCDVVAVLPHVDEMTAMANKDIFALHYPQHSLTQTLKNAAISLTT